MPNCVPEWSACDSLKSSVRKRDFLLKAHQLMLYFPVCIPCASRFALLDVLPAQGLVVLHMQTVH
jgi:hypothetical protein